MGSQGKTHSDCCLEYNCVESGSVLADGGRIHEGLGQPCRIRGKCAIWFDGTTIYIGYSHVCHIYDTVCNGVLTIRDMVKCTHHLPNALTRFEIDV